MLLLGDAAAAAGGPLRYCYLTDVKSPSFHNYNTVKLLHYDENDGEVKNSSVTTNGLLFMAKLSDVHRMMAASNTL